MRPASTFSTIQLSTPRVSVFKVSTVIFKHDKRMSK